MSKVSVNGEEMYLIERGSCASIVSTQPPNNSSWKSETTVFNSEINED